jgi:KaiC/GvpD/RAD55 family RecA-like ATPase
LEQLGSWAAAQQARGQLVLLSGEPGVGKTRLPKDLAHAQQSGATVCAAVATSMKRRRVPAVRRGVP